MIGINLYFLHKLAEKRKANKQKSYTLRNWRQNANSNKQRNNGA